MTEETAASEFLGTHKPYRPDRATPTERPRNAGDRPACPACVHWDCSACGHRHPNQDRRHLDRVGRRCVRCSHHKGEQIAVYHRSDRVTEEHRREYERPVVEIETDPDVGFHLGVVSLLARLEPVVFEMAYARGEMAKTARTSERFAELANGNLANVRRVSAELAAWLRAQPADVLATLLGEDVGAGVSDPRSIVPSVGDHACPECGSPFRRASGGSSCVHAAGCTWKAGTGDVASGGPLAG